MTSSARLLTSVSPEQQRIIAALAAERGVSISGLLAALVRKEITEHVKTAVNRFIKEQREGAAAEKYTVRLTGVDATRLEERAKGRSLTPSGYAAHVLRAHLRAQPPMPYQEFQDLKRVTNELAAIRGELQKLLVPNTSIAIVDEWLHVTIARLVPALKQIRGNVQDALIANSKSWEAPDA